MTNLHPKIKTNLHLKTDSKVRTHMNQIVIYPTQRARKIEIILLINSIN